MFDSFIWDFDGTLFDTYPFMTECLKDALCEMGVSENKEVLLSELKISVSHAVKLFAQKYALDVQELNRRFRSYDHNSSNSIVKPFPGLADVLSRIQNAGGVSYIYSHRGTDLFDYLKKFDISSYFADIITIDMPFPRKPAPDALLYLIDKHHLAKDGCVMIGDRDIDIQAGENAGITGCLFDPCGFYSDFKTSLRAQSMAQIGDILLGKA